ncbi:MAG: hypothetical protein JEY91_19125 [Spirochaetaceae bacterium]|nr:hypothetical protein [Spirochaetaceae bacterium]
MPFKLSLRLLIIFLFLSGLFSLNANPFLGNSEDEVTPAVRPPGSYGFMVETQLKFRERIGEILTDIKENPSRVSFGVLLGMALLYGVLHAAGPGHRKTIMFSMFLTRKARWFEPLAAGFLSASVHAGTALFLIVFYRSATKKILSNKIDNTSQYLEGITYILLIFISLWFISHIIVQLVKKQTNSQHRVKGHGLYTTLLITSVFPCPGVIMILTFSAALEVLCLGILAVLALSVGMGLTISLVGYLALTGRGSLFKALKQKGLFVEKLASILELGSFIFLLFFSFWMAYPFIASIVVI